MYYSNFPRKQWVLLRPCPGIRQVNTLPGPQLCCAEGHSLHPSRQGRGIQYNCMPNPRVSPPPPPLQTSQSSEVQCSAISEFWLGTWAPKIVFGEYGRGEKILAPNVCVLNMLCHPHGGASQN